MTVKTRAFDAAEYLDGPEAISAYLADAFASNDIAEIADALGIAARARGMSRLAEETGLNRQQLYRTLSVGGRPELGTVLKVADALGFRLELVPKVA